MLMSNPLNQTPPLAKLQGTVLVVDDIDYMRKQMSHILRQGGVANVVEANEGGAAFELLRTAPGVYGMVISDLEMDPLSGLHLLRLLRTDKDTPGALRTIPFILVAAGATQAILAEARALGVDGFIAKPFTGATLLKTAAKVVETRLAKRH